MGKQQVYTLKKGDTSIPFKATLRDDDGAIDLTGYTAVFYMRLPGETTNKVDGLVCVIDPDQITNKGVVRYWWDASDVDTALDYDAEVKATDGAGKFVRFPRDKDAPYVRVCILENLE